MEDHERSIEDFGWGKVAPCKPYLINILFHWKPDHDFFEKGYVPENDIES
jgi:hypothetical protein